MNDISGVVWTYDEVVTLLEWLMMYPTKDTDALFETVVEVYHWYRQTIAEQSSPASATPVFAALCKV